MGRDSGVNMPSCTQLVAQRTATELELAAARGYLDSLDDAAIWHLLREHRATATQWDNKSQQQQKPPFPLAKCLVEGVRYLHPVSSNYTNRSRSINLSTSLLTVCCVPVLARHPLNVQALFEYQGSSAPQISPRCIRQQLQSERRLVHAYVPIPDGPYMALPLQPTVLTCTRLHRK